MTEFNTRLHEIADQIGISMERVLPPVRGPEAPLIEAMRHGALGGGKRLRPYLVVETGRMFEVKEQALLRAGAALECIHAYSLIHDDLPCMDDDDMRRGQASLHKQFGESTAMLAGDGLLTLAFGILAARDTHSDPKLRCELIEAASHRAGITGMVGGQMIDLMVSQKPDLDDEQDLPLLTRMLRMKTGSLFALAADFGAILGHANPQERHALAGYTHDLGLAYQIADDIKDADKDKNPTGIVNLLGRDTAIERLHLLAAQARQHLAPFGNRAEHLINLVNFIGAQAD